MRLTTKRGNNYDFDENDQIEEVSAKLGQLEDIEEELGIDLVTLFKALKNGIYLKYNGKIKFYNDDEIAFNWVGKTPEIVLLKRKKDDCYAICISKSNEPYKIWALTKEELL